MKCSKQKKIIRDRSKKHMIQEESSWSMLKKLMEDWYKLKKSAASGALAICFQPGNSENSGTSSTLDLMSVLWLCEYL
ncbi:hypothetical protein YC2023_108811 [Brassica napus]